MRYIRGCQSRGRWVICWGVDCHTAFSLRDWPLEDFLKPSGRSLLNHKIVIKTGHYSSWEHPFLYINDLKSCLNNFLYFGCAGSLLLCGRFSSWGELRLLSSCGARVTTEQYTNNTSNLNNTGDIQLSSFIKRVKVCAWSKRQGMRKGHLVASQTNFVPVFYVKT